MPTSRSQPGSDRPALGRFPENGFPSSVSTIAPIVDPPLPVKMLASKNVFAEYTLGKFKLHGFPTGLQGNGPNCTGSIAVTDAFGSADIDATQNLFAWVEYDDRSAQGEAPRRGMKVHMVDLTTGDPHQLAYEHGNFSRTMPHPGVPIFSRLVIAGDLIAVGTVYSREGATNHISPLIVFNWKTGDQVPPVTPQSWMFDFCFLDDQHILLYSLNFRRAARQDALLVYKLGEQGTQPYAFFMPKTIFAKSNHPILKSSYNRPSLTDALIGVHVCNGTLTPYGMEAEGSIDFLFHASTLKARIAACAQPRHFAWAEWGPSDAQMTKAAYRNIEIDSHFLAGMCAVDVVKGTDDKMCLSIRDFDRDRVGQARLRGGNNLLEGVVVESSTVDAGAWSEDAIETRLPFVHRLVPLTNEKLRNINESYAWTVTEDAVVLYDALESKRHIRVLHRAFNP